jgi:hypothetical protein
MRYLKTSFALFWGVIALALFSLTASAEKQPETGVIKDGVYHDTRFGFSLKIPAEWREAKLRKEPTAERLTLTQRKHRIPLKLQDSPEQAQKPMVLILADTCSMTPEAFFTFLQRDTVKSEIKSRILSKSVFLEQGSSNRIEVLDRTPATVAGKSALKIRCRIEYAAAVVSASATATPIMVRDFRVGFIYIIPFDGWLMYIEEVAENQFLPSLTPDFDLVVTSLALDSAGVK